jgi:hypothetical protein
MSMIGFRIALTVGFACLVPRILAFSFSLIANPAASSPARVIRSPEDNFLKLLSKFSLVVERDL